MKNKVLTLLGFAAKAGRLGFGMKATADALKSGKSKLVVMAEDVSPKSQKEVLFFSHNKKIPVKTLKDTTITDVSEAVGRKCGIISVNDIGFADAIFDITGGNANDK